ncbi:MAG TPA: DNA gyrase subunit A [Bacteroidaceae bacterium]|nr:DNA gyrase subunit A [Bacteroidaceae bacterium]MBP8603089.1 DNA gyrase subunit A [Bacteroidaceae bacterium]HPX98696.1 DNA gyrase subunit A [Bacteroidaceae bacterium]
MDNQDRIIRVNIEEEMKSSYIDYSMSVIVSRALPDARDGLKPVHRRILYSMMRDGNTSDKGYRKSARTVGNVLGHFHPHGDLSVYGTLVRLAQDWIMRYPLVDGQGNFGSVDGDSPAAMRYTEVRLRKIGEEMMQDIDKNTVDFVPNYDNKEEEPTILPTCIPNLLVNGSSGIAVGMATNMPPHNLTEVLNGCMAMIDNPDITVEELMQYVKAPDFPTGGFIYGISGVRDAFETGRGRVIMRARTEIESEPQHDKIIVTEIPYGVNKADLIKFIAALVTDKKIDGISNVNDESDREGMRIVIEIKRDANTGVVLNKLFKMTSLQTSFSVNNIALVKGRPKCLNLRELIECFNEHRHEVVTRRTQYDLDEAKKRAHIIEGLIIASDNIDEVIHIIRSAKNPNDAIQELMERFELDEIQAKAIVDMRLRQLTGLMQDQLHNEYNDMLARIEELQSILNDPEKCKQLIKDEMQSIIDKYGDGRKTEIVLASEEFNPEDFYADEPMIITISNLGYIKRTALTEYRLQGRGGVGSKGSDKRDEDFIEHIFTATTHNYILFFTQKGRCYWLRVFDIPEGSKTSKGRAIQNMLNIEPDDAINAYIAIESLDDEEFISNHYLVFCTQNGLIKKTILKDYSRPRQNGIIAIKLNDGDKVIDVLLTDGNKEIIIANRNGRAIRFNESTVRAMGRVSIGVRAMTLDDDGEDCVVGMIAVDEQPEETIMVISEQGYGKRSEIEDYRKTNRGGKGVKTLNITEKTGKLVSIQAVTDDNDLVIINKSGITLRVSVSDFRIMGRATQGVILINLEKRNDEIGSVCKVDSEPEELEEPQIEDEDDADYVNHKPEEEEENYT